MMAFSLAACGGDKSGNKVNTPAPSNASEETQGGQMEELKPEPGAELLIWNGGKELMEEFGKAFEAKYGVKVIYGGDQNDPMNMLLTDGPAGVAADVFLSAHDRLGGNVTAGLILPNDYFEEETKMNTLENAVNAVSVDGILYGYPDSVETTAVYYNKDLISNVPETWQGVIDFAKTFNDPKNNKYAYMWSAGNAYWNYGFFAGYGAYVFGKNGTDPNDIGMNNAGAVEAGKFIQSLHDILPIKSGDLTGDLNKSLFEQKKLAMLVSGPWDAKALKKIVPNVGVAPYPILPNGKPMKPFAGVQAWFVNSYSKYPNAAKLFANFVSSEENQLKRFELYGNLPANKKASSSEKIMNDPIASGFMKQFENSEPMPLIPEIKIFWDTTEAALGSIWNDKADPKTTLDALVKQMNNGIAATKK